MDVKSETGKPEHGVVAEGLTKVFRSRGKGEVRAVDDVSFRARFGEIFGLLGVNGAGKTTTLRMIATMLRPTAGQAEVCGRSVVDQPAEVRKRIGFMSSATSLYGRLTAREMVRYFGRLNGLPEKRIEQRTEELFDLFDMKAFAERRCDRLSSGMKQKVSIVRTVIHDPDVMVFDEPTAGLDVLTSRTIVEFVRDCRRRNKCVVFSTHIMEEVEKLCDRVGVIHGGKLLALEETDALRGRVGSGRVEDAFVELVENRTDRKNRGELDEVETEPEGEPKVDASERGE
jgi:sodium transport system ATP-binding protein